MRVAFLPPMSGLAATETRLDEGAVNVRVGEGRTAEVLRNLCFRVSTEHPERWRTVVETIEGLFGARLNEPRYVRERGEVAMDYAEDDVRLDLSSSGRGLQQTLLILAYLHANPGAVVLLDEPDAHLEILRQREIYRLLTDTASRCGSQIIAASHSEVILNEAAGKHLAIAFVGKPHPIDGGRSQVRKALAEIGFEQYVQAEQNGWVLYLEGSTDLAILQAFARRLGHRAAGGLERPFVHYVGNQPAKAKRHYFALREALPELRGVALFDRLEPRRRRANRSSFLRGAGGRSRTTSAPRRRSKRMRAPMRTARCRSSTAATPDGASRRCGRPSPRSRTPCGPWARGRRGVRTSRRATTSWRRCSTRTSGVSTCRT